MHRFRVRLAPLVALALALTPAACSDDLLGPQDAEDVNYDPSLGVDLDQMTELDSGVYIQTLVQGEGESTGVGATVIIDYTLWLPNGTEINSGTDAQFQLDNVIEGFSEGMIGMQEGERRLIVVPSYLGYGAAGDSQAGIPPHSVLVFMVDLIELNPPI